MSRVTCTNCGGAHTPWDCKRPSKKSTAPKIEILGNDNVGSAQPTLPSAGEPMKGSGQAYNTPADDAPPVDTNSLPMPKANGPTLGVDVGVGGDANSEKGRVFAAPLGLASPANAPDAGTENTKDAPIQKRPRGRPKSITDMKMYKAAKQREYRAKWKGLVNPPKGIDPRVWEGAVEDIVYDIEVDYDGYFDKGKLERDILTLIYQAIEAEREECAKIADPIHYEGRMSDHEKHAFDLRDVISQAIRNRSNTTTEESA